MKKYKEYEDKELARRREKKRVLRAIRDIQKERRKQSRKLFKKKKGYRFSGKKYLEAIDSGYVRY